MTRSLGVILLLVCIVSCAGQDRYLKAEPGMHVSRTAQPIPVDDDLKPLVTILLVDPNGKLVQEGDPNEQAIYYSVDISNLMGRSNLGFSGSPTDSELMNRRNKVIEILIMVGDLNTETYLSRAFASNLYIRGFRGALNRSLTALQTGTSLISPETTAALGVLNLGISGIGDEYSKLVFADKTFEALQNAIEAERSEQKIKIYEGMKKSYSEYSMQNAIPHLKSLAEASSIRIGINKLVSLSESDKDQQEKAVSNLK